MTGEGTFSVNGDYVTWYDSEDTTGTGSILELVFTAADGVEDCDTYVKVALKDGKAANLSNGDYENVPVTFTAGCVSIANGVLGDVTGDNDVAINDVVKLNKYVLGKITLTDTELKLGDVTADGDVAINDVVKLNKYVLGKITTLEVSQLATMAEAPTYVEEIAYSMQALMASADSKAVSISSLTNSASKTLLVKWGKNTTATGYEIQYSTSSKFTSGKTVTITKNSTVSTKLTNLTKGKTYYVRVRAYKTVNKVKYYSAWSASKKCKVSK